jgi:hypothetical protein
MSEQEGTICFRVRDEVAKVWNSLSRSEKTEFTELFRELISLYETDKDVIYDVWDCIEGEDSTERVKTALEVLNTLADVRGKVASNQGLLNEVDNAIALITNMIVSKLAVRLVTQPK